MPRDIGERSAALREFERAAQFAKSDPAILGNLAQAYAELGRHAEAQRVFRKASRLEPRTLRYAQGAAIALAQQGKTAEAEPMLQRLAERFPDASSLWYNLDNLYRKGNRWREFENCFREALRREPGNTDAHNNPASVLHSQLRFDEAIAEYRVCINTNPDDVAVRLNLVSALIDVGRFEQATDSCRDLPSRTPASPEAHRFLAAALSHQGNVIDALPSFARLAPADPLSQHAYGGALDEAGRVHHALRTLTAVQKLEPDADAQQQILSSVLLSHGMLTDDWSAYRRRPAFLRFAEKLGADTLAQRLPADLAGKHVLVLREQGIGDELFFLRYAPRLRALGANITIRATAKVAALIARAACADNVIAGDADPTAPVDLQLLCGDLPHALHPVMRSASTAAGV
ncbi:MAG: tetratricopeptide repeat protein [Betaproteobacteria bacterium]